MKETALRALGRAVAGTAVLALLAACSGTPLPAPAGGPGAAGGAAAPSPAGGSGIEGLVLPRGGPAATPKAAGLRGLTAAQILTEAGTNSDQVTSYRKKTVEHALSSIGSNPVSYAEGVWDVHVTPVGCAGTLTATPAPNGGAAAVPEVVEAVLIGADEWVRSNAAGARDWTPDLPADRVGTWVKQTSDAPTSPLDADVCDAGGDGSKTDLSDVGTVTAGPAVTVDGQACLTFAEAESGAVFAVTDTDHPYVVAAQLAALPGQPGPAGTAPAGVQPAMTTVVSEIGSAYPIAAPPADQVYGG
ncbi:hypothetical protein ACFXDE_08075 [Kitasatospora sp. NPDC059408]|uniref:hypothetical protein n=1 Tax=Kitasatospora sp. NPDC059408 TaxID=3346823 RepID=UPI0036C7009E